MLKSCYRDIEIITPKDIDWPMDVIVLDYDVHKYVLAYWLYKNKRGDWIARTYCGDHKVLAWKDFVNI